MAVFRSIRTIPTNVADLNTVAEGVKKHFETQLYEVSIQPGVNSCMISLRKGGLFKSVLGMKTALNITLSRTGDGINADASVGIFGMQAIPTLIMYFVAWPVLLTQVWGLIQQAKLDNEALDCVERVITAMKSKPAGLFCTACGASVPADSTFCPKCGGKL